MSLAKVLNGLSSLSLILKQLSVDVEGLKQDLVPDTQAKETKRPPTENPVAQSVAEVKQDTKMQELKLPSTENPLAQSVADEKEANQDKKVQELKGKRPPRQIPLGQFIVNTNTIGDSKSLPKNGGIIVIIGARRTGKSTLCHALYKALQVSAEAFHVYAENQEDEFPDLYKVRHRYPGHYFVLQYQNTNQIPKKVAANLDMIFFSTEILNTHILPWLFSDYKNTIDEEDRNIYAWNGFLQTHHDGIKRLHRLFGLELYLPVTLPFTFPKYSFVACDVHSDDPIVID